MQTASADGLLQLWELGLEAGLHERGTLLLHAARPGTSPDALWALPLGRRNEALLALRAALFGGELGAVGDCPVCGAMIELVLPLPEWTDGADDASPPPLVVANAGFEVELRLPTADDLRRVPSGDIETTTLALLDRCVVEARRDGHVVTADALPAQVLDLVGEAMAAADPRGVLEIVTSCPSCGETSTLVLEPAVFVWSELHRWAEQTLRDVHELASAYGWAESDILAMSATRRQAYLDLASA